MWAYFDVKGNDAYVNRVARGLKKRGIDVQSWEKENLRKLIVKYKSRPLFYGYIEREIDFFYNKIMKAISNKKHYSRKGRKHESN